MDFKDFVKRVLLKLLLVGCLGGAVIWGIKFITPIIEDNKIHQGICNVTAINFRPIICSTSTNSYSDYYYSVNVQGYFVQNTSANGTKKEKWNAKSYTSLHSNVSWLNAQRSVNDVLWYDDSSNNTIDCTEFKNRTEVNLKIRGLFPESNIGVYSTKTSFAYYSSAYASSSAIYPQSWLYNCFLYYRFGDNNVLLSHSNTNKLLMIPFFALLIGILVAFQLVRKFGHDDAFKEFCDGLHELSKNLLTVPYIVLSLVVYIAVFMVFINCFLGFDVMDMDEFLNKGGFVMPILMLYKCCKRGECPRCTCCVPSSDVTIAPAPEPNTRAHIPPAEPTERSHAPPVRASSFPNTTLSEVLTNPVPQYPANSQFSDPPPPSYDDLYKNDY